MEGKTVILTNMHGEDHMKENMIGIITKIDDAVQIHVKWENGSNLALIPELDNYRVLSHKKIKIRKTK